MTSPYVYIYCNEDENFLKNIRDKIMIQHINNITLVEILKYDVVVLDSSCANFPEWNFHAHIMRFCKKLCLNLRGGFNPITLKQFLINYKIKFLITSVRDYRLNHFQNLNKIFHFDLGTINGQTLNTILEEIHKLSKTDLFPEDSFHLIDQIYIAEHLRPGFANLIYKNTHLKPYYDRNKPTFFYGFLANIPEDCQALKKHLGDKIIIWTGGDIDYKKNPRIRESLKLLATQKNVYHVAISKFIKQDLNELRINHSFIPFVGLDMDQINPIPRGNKIYIYTAERNEDIYGKSLYSQIIKNNPGIKFVKAQFNKKIAVKIKHYDRETLLAKIYPKCFLGLRLTSHDGLSATVLELGLMGIPCIHNGSSPSSINYNNLQDIQNIIDRESKKVGQVDFDLARRVKEYITPNFRIFSSYYYRNKNRYLYLSNTYQNANANHNHVFKWEPCFGIDFYYLKNIESKRLILYDVICLDYSVIREINPIKEFLLYCKKICVLANHKAMLENHIIEGVQYFINADSNSTDIKKHFQLAFPKDLLDRKSLKEFQKSFYRILEQVDLDC